MKKILSAIVLAALLLTVATGALAATGVGTVTAVSCAAATADAAGSVEVDTTVCAVTIDEEGKITSISFDVVQSKGTFDATGALTCEATMAPQSKKELGEGYGMGKYSPIGKEYDEQMEALEAWCIGKTVEEVLGMKTFDRGDGHHTMVPDEADLKTGCTISVGDYLKALEKAAAAAK